MNRQIIFDTETTGLKVKDGHRVIEIACLEMIDGKLTGDKFHCYINPEGREIDAEAIATHGLTLDFLKDKPTFKDIYPEFLQFVSGAELIAHNSDFDVEMLNAELDRVNMRPLWDIASKITCTLRLAKSLSIKGGNSLDNVCTHYGISIAERNLHGALIDCDLLAQVYQKMMDEPAPYIDDAETAKEDRAPITRITNRPSLATIALSEEDVQRNEQYLDLLAKACDQGAVARRSVSKPPKL